MAFFSGFHFSIFNKARSAIGAPRETAPSSVMPLGDKAGLVGHVTSYPTSGITSQQAEEAGLTPLPRIVVETEPAKIHRLSQTPLPVRSVPDKIAVEAIGPHVFAHGRFNRSIFDPVPQHIIHTVRQHAEKVYGLSWTPEEIEQIKKDLVSWNHCQAMYSIYHWNRVREIFARDTEKFSQSIAAGGSPTPPTRMTEADIDSARKPVNMARAEISTRTHDRLVPKCELMRQAATDLLTARFPSEKEACQKQGFAFEPSQTLRALVFIACQLWESPIEHFIPGTNACLAPSNLFFGHKIFDAPDVPKLVEPNAEFLARVDVEIARQKEKIAARQTGEIENRKAAHRAELERISAQNDALRTEAEQASAKLREERAKANATPVRIIQ